MKKNKGYFRSAFGGIAVGIIAVMAGGWLYSGSMSDEFTCSISFIPCELAGPCLIAGGVVVGILGLLGKLK